MYLFMPTKTFHTFFLWENTNIMPSSSKINAQANKHLQCENIRWGREKIHFINIIVWCIEFLIFKLMHTKYSARLQCEKYNIHEQMHILKTNDQTQKVYHFLNWKLKPISKNAHTQFLFGRLLFINKISIKNFHKTRILVFPTKLMNKYLCKLQFFKCRNKNT